MKLFKLAWDMTGSEFAGRHLQYEKFYAGASFIIRNHSYRETDWTEFNALVDKVHGRLRRAEGKKARGGGVSCALHPPESRARDAARLAPRRTEAERCALAAHFSGIIGSIT